MGAAKKLVVPYFIIAAVFLTYSKNASGNTILHGGSNYTFNIASGPKPNWEESRKYCIEAGGDLVSIESIEEWTFIKNAIQNFQTPEHFIGLKKDGKSKKWRWVSGNRNMDPLPWAKHEPSGNGNCVIMYKDYRKDYGEYNDLGCTRSRRAGYICESLADSNDKEDTDECAVSNGGCSHKCVNIAEGYKCECPDPELSLSLDNRTCHAPGVDFKCNNENMTIMIPKSLLRGIDRDHLRLMDRKCKAKESRSHFFLTTPLTGCNTTRRQTPTAIVYSNTVLEIPVAAKDVVTRVREIEIQFSCFYSKNGVVTSAGWKLDSKKLVFSDGDKGNFALSLNMFRDKRFVSPYEKDDFPVTVELRKLLFFEVSVALSDKQLSITADRCYATPIQDQNSPLKYEFIKKGCPNDVTVKYHSAPSVSAQRFSLEAFKFIADHKFVFVYCHVIVCSETDPDSKCSRNCLSSDRGRRAVSDHVTEMYDLAQGPLQLSPEKQDEKRGEEMVKSGSSPNLLMVLFLICAACLVGTALMIFKKSRDKPSEHDVVANGDHH